MRVIKKRYKQRARIKGYKPEKPGDLVEIDSITIFVEGIRRYIITGIDIVSRFSFSYGYKSLNSENAKDFIERFRKVAHFEIKRVQTDNGSEFERCFRGYLEREGISQYYIYPRHPQSNGYIERFNRSIQEQYINWNMEEIKDIEGFNRGLMDYLLWYNIEKPHRGLQGETPVNFLIKNFLKKSNMYRYLTIYCQSPIFYVK